MKVSKVLASVLAVASCCSTVTGFTTFSPSIVFNSNKKVEKNTILYISSWGSSGPPSRQGDTVRENPEKKIQAYLKDPEAVEVRNTIDGKCMVSGLVNAKERTDQFIFDLLNHEESAFEFDKIVAFVDNAAFSKKRLLSRSARYTGLLDKLEFIEATSAGAMPTAEQLAGIKSWVAHIEASGENDDTVLEKIKTAAALAKDAPSVENIAILVSNAIGLDVTKSEEALNVLKGDGSVTYSLAVVGKLEDRPEGKVAYKFEQFGTAEAALGSEEVFSRDEGMRMITELLQLEAGSNKALAIAEVHNATQLEAKLVKGLREAGYIRMQEIDHMLTKGVEAYKTFIEEWKQKNPDAAKGYTTDAWWEDEKFQKSIRRRVDREEKEVKLEKDARTKEIETVAKEWAKREYFKQSMAGQVGEKSEEEFIESVWDRALFEGELVYRRTKGEVVDEENELADFKKRQERKQEMMLKRAKQDLAEILEKEDLVDDDIKQVLSTESDDEKDKKD